MHNPTNGIKSINSFTTGFSLETKAVISSKKKIPIIPNGIHIKIGNNAVKDKNCSLSSSVLYCE
ncbi:hypothetical protein D3C85_1078450 [compost metagenome]